MGMSFSYYLLRATLALVTVGVLPLSAQRHQAPVPVRFGVIVGAARATASDDFSGSGFASDALTAGTVGISAAVPVTPWLQFRPELQLSQRGIREPNTDVGEVRIRLTYIDIPLLLIARASEVGRVKPNLQIGPTIGYNVRCSFSIGGVGESCSRIGDGGVNRIDYGAVLGAGADVRVGGRELRTSLRYTHGLRDFSRGVEARHRTLQIMLGVDF